VPVPGLFLLVRQEPSVYDPAAGQRQPSLGGIQDQVRSRQRTLIAIENSLFVQQSCLFERLCLVSHRCEHRPPAR